MDPWYVTTAIPYVNARPHIGFALEAVLTDAFARYRRATGRDVRFLTGTDDNSLKNVQAAEEAGLPVAEFVARNTEAFLGLRTPLDLSFDDFIRTSDETRHRAGVEKIWRACEQSGDIYSKQYKGLYCVGCEQFYSTAELIDGKCPEHGTVPEQIEETNYFFKLSRYGDKLLELISSGALTIIPETRRNEVTSFIRQGLEDFSISRSSERARGWGVPVPGDASQVVYVWFDALCNYITALGFAEEDELYKRFWTECPDRVHVIGKGIIRFHAVYWPAMLLSAGVPLPTHVFVHGYLTIGGQKISKSLGNVIDPVALAEQYGTDPLRYFLLRHIRATADGDFTAEALERAHDADLADQLGNLVARVASMITRYFDGVVPAESSPVDAATKLREVAEATPSRIADAMDNFATHEALAAIWDLVGAANRMIVEVEPWTLAKKREAEPEAGAQLATTLHALAETLRITAELLIPYLPSTAEAIAQRIGITLAHLWNGALGWSDAMTGKEVNAGDPMFPKLIAPKR